MRYFVIGDDGQKYGPADVNTLNDWIGQQRLLPTQQLEEEASGTRMAASSVPGLNFPLQSAPGAAGQDFTRGPSNPYANQPLQGNYYRPNTFADDGSKDVQTAWIYAVLGIFCCIFLHIGSFSYAQKAAIKGNPKAAGPRIFSTVMLVLQLIYIAIRIYMAIKNPGSNPFRRA